VILKHFATNHDLVKEDSIVRVVVGLGRSRRRVDSLPKTAPTRLLSP